MLEENANDDVIVENTSDAVSDQQDNGSGASSTPQNTDVQSGVDETGVSYKNRWLEANRKLDNLTKSIPQMIQEAASTAAKQTQVNSQPEYSAQDYLKAKAQDPANAAFYDSKILELQEKNIQNTVSKQLTEFEQKRQAEIARQQADNWALTNFPQLRDPNNAFSQQVWNVFNSRSADKREPHDFALAAELVAARMGVKPATLTNTQQDKVLQKERELKKLNRERAIEGDGRGHSSVATNTQKTQAFKEALESGDASKRRAYILNHWLKPNEAEQ